MGAVGNKLIICDVSIVINIVVIAADDCMLSQCSTASETKLVVTETRIILSKWIHNVFK